MSEAARLTDERLIELCTKYRGGIERIDHSIRVVQFTEVLAMAEELKRLRASLPPDAAGDTEKCDTCEHTRFVDVTSSPASTRGQP